jgi:RNA polymerase-interacting CarD/CdnL/TRCF family regulator
VSVFALGDRVFLASAGVATIAGVAGRGPGGKPSPLAAGEPPVFFVVRADELVACVPIANAGETLRPLCSREVAEAAVAILRGPPPTELSTRALVDRGRDAVHEGSTLEMARVLREMRALPGPLSEALESGQLFLDRLVTGEIEAVLGYKP